MINSSYLFAFIVFFVLTTEGMSQTTISRQVIGSSGSSVNVSFGNVSYNVGETAVKTTTGTDITLTQGFEQPAYSIDATPINFEINNAFSPNGDGVNDYWHINGAQFYGNNKVIIFNRWGDILMQFENYNNIDVVWNGTNESGKAVPSGTYYYVIEFIDQNQHASGWVQVTK